MVEKFNPRNVEIKEKSPEEKALDRIRVMNDKVDELFRSGFNYKNEKGNECWLASGTSYVSSFEKDSRGVVKERTIQFNGKNKVFELVIKSHGDEGQKVLSKEELPKQKVNGEIDKFEEELRKWELQKLKSDVKK